MIDDRPFWVPERGVRRLCKYKIRLDVSFFNDDTPILARVPFTFTVLQSNRTTHTPRWTAQAVPYEGS